MPRLKTGRHTILVHELVVEYISECGPVSDAALNVDEIIFTELIVYASPNFVKLFVQTLAFLQAMPLLNSGLLTWLHKH